MIRNLASRYLPKSLFGQTLLILLVGLVVSHLIGAWIYAGAREQAVRAIGGFAAAQRVANLSRLIDEAPGDWRPRIVQALNDPTFHVSLSSRPPDPSPNAADGPAQAIRDVVLQQLPDWPDREVRVVVSGPAGATPGQPFDRRPFGGPMGGMNGMMRDMMGPAYVGPGFGAWRTLDAAVKLSDGQWLTFATALPQSAPTVSWQFIIALAMMGLIVLAVSAWAVRSVTAPLGLMAAAADRLGRDVTATPLAETGTTEMRTAARAFNRMQERLRRLIESRTQMLAALSHDLRTPLTLLRLRAEEVADADERDKMLATIGEMDAMIGTTLAFARDEVRAEPRRRVDVAALVASVVDDMADAGLPVAMTPAAALAYDCQPGALKRAVSKSSRQRGEIRRARPHDDRPRGECGRDRHRRRRTGDPRRRNPESVPAVLPGRGLAQPRHWRDRARPRDSAIDRPGARRRTHSRQPRGRGPTGLHQVADLAARAKPILAERAPSLVAEIGLAARKGEAYQVACLVLSLGPPRRRCR